MTCPALQNLNVKTFAYFTSRSFSSQPQIFDHQYIQYLNMLKVVDRIWGWTEIFQNSHCQFFQYDIIVKSTRFRPNFRLFERGTSLCFHMLSTDVNTNRMSNVITNFNIKYVHTLFQSCRAIGSCVVVLHLLNFLALEDIWKNSDNISGKRLKFHDLFMTLYCP